MTAGRETRRDEASTRFSPFPSPPKSCNVRANTPQAVPATALSSQVQPSGQKHPWQCWAPATRSASLASHRDTTIAEPPVPAEARERRWEGGGLEQVICFTLYCQTLADPFLRPSLSTCPPSAFLARGPAGRRCPPSPGPSLLVPRHMEAATSQGAAARARGFPSDTPAFSPTHAAVAGGFLQRGECFLSAARGQRRAASLTEVNH